MSARWAWAVCAALGCGGKAAPIRGSVGANSGAGADTGDVGGETGAGGPISAPAWLPAALTVPAEGGWAWEIDPDFELPAASVPSVFIGEGGTYGMLLGEQRGLNTGRDVIWSEDGLRWSAPAPLISADDFEGACGLRLEDGGLWEAGTGGRWLVLEGTQSTEGELNVPTGRRLCLAQLDARPGGAAAPASPPVLWEGCGPDDVISVPGILPMAEAARIFFNGTCGGDTAGVHAIDVQADTLDVAVSQPEAQLPGQIVDPNPVYREGGGVDMFVKLRDEEQALNGIARVRLTDDGRAVAGDPVPLLWPAGPCFKPDQQSGPCYADPSFVRAADGRLVLYFGELIEGPGTITTRVRRAFATDWPPADSGGSPP